MQPDEQTPENVPTEADVTAHADRPPTPDEERVAERVSADVDPDVAEHYEEMAEIGAEVKGEGEIDPG